MTEQRRQFFRVQDEAIFQVEQCDPEALAQIKKDIFEQNFDHKDVFKRFFKFESDLQTILFNNKSLNPDWVNIVDLLNVKINQLARLLAAENETIFNHAPQPINLSANGLGLELPYAIPEGSHIKVELILLPQYTYLTLVGRVMNCAKKEKPEGQAAYTVGVQIEVIRPQDTDRLIQHIMKKEAEWLKYRREQSLAQTKPPATK